MDETQVSADIPVKAVEEAETNDKVTCMICFRIYAFFMDSFRL